MDDRRSHWPIYDVVPIEMIKVVSEAVRNAPVESKDGMVIYFPSKGGGSFEKIKERREE